MALCPLRQIPGIRLLVVLDISDRLGLLVSVGKVLLACVGWGATAGKHAYASVSSSCMFSSKIFFLYSFDLRMLEFLYRMSTCSNDSPI